MSDLEKRVLTLEVDSTAGRLSWQLFGVVFCSLFGITNLIGGAYIAAVIFLVLAGINVWALPKTWERLKELKEKLKTVE